jgi:hypothetical protein
MLQHASWVFMNLFPLQSVSFYESLKIKNHNSSPKDSATVTRGLYYTNIMVINDNHHEWFLYY